MVGPVGFEPTLIHLRKMIDFPVADGPKFKTLVFVVDLNHLTICFDYKRIILFEDYCCKCLYGANGGN